MNTDCPICCSPFNKSTAKCITCPRPDCAKTACKSCVTTYLLGSSLDPHCMHCHVAWEQDFLSDNLTIVFLKKDYGKHLIIYLKILKHLLNKMMKNHGEVFIIFILFIVCYYKIGK